MQAGQLVAFLLKPHLPRITSSFMTPNFRRILQLFCTMPVSLPIPLPVGIANDGFTAICQSFYAAGIALLSWL